VPPIAIEEVLAVGVSRLRKRQIGWYRGEYPVPVLGWDFLIVRLIEYRLVFFGGDMSSETILDELEQILKSAQEALAKAQDETSLQSWRSTHIGRSAPVMQVFNRLPEVTKELRPQVGQRANQVKQTLEAA
jgi:hypothetical protein